MAKTVVNLLDENLALKEELKAVKKERDDYKRKLNGLVMTCSGIAIRLKDRTDDLKKHTRLKS